MSDQPAPERPAVKRVTSAELCKLFNEGGYWESAKAGTLTQHILERRWSKMLTQETVPIESQIVSYRDQANNEIARVHQFIRPDGSIAASGRPDPKRLLEGGILYRLEKKKKIPSPQ